MASAAEQQAAYEARFARRNLAGAPVADEALQDQPPSAALVVGKPAVPFSNNRQLFAPGYPNRGQPDKNCDLGYNNLQTPENVNGSGPCDDPDHWVCDRARGVPGYLTDLPPDAITLRSIDYSLVGTIGQARAVYYMLEAAGAADVTNYPLTITAAAGTGTTATFDDSPQAPFSIGFAMFLGVAYLSFTPFTVTIFSAGFKSFGSNVSVDRSVQLYFSRAVGGTIWVPWATRISPPQTFGIWKVARATAAGDTATVQLSGLPTVVANGTSAAVQFLSSDTPLARDLADGIGLNAG